MTPTSSFKLVLILVLLGCATQSCVKDAIDLEQDDIQSSKIDDNIPYGEALILGKQLENPFSVDKMERALNTIQRTERQATINFINETSDSIKSTEGCDLDIDSGSSLTFEVKNNLGGKPNIDNFPVSIFSNCSMMYKDGNIFRCEKGIEDIKSYENRLQLASKEDTLVFEFTFRFTELKKANAEPCN